MKNIRIASVSVDQTPLDWEQNLSNLRSALALCRSNGADLICFPELCLPGYGCEDMFFAKFVRERSLELLRSLIPETSGIVCSFGLPLEVKEEIFNTCALVADQKLLGFSAKHYLAKEGVYYEPRWFSPWNIGRVENVSLEGKLFPVGDLVFDLDGIGIAFEICEDAWADRRYGCELSSAGVDIFLNPSASHFAFGKQDIRKKIVVDGSQDFDAVYVYANHIGNDSGRLIFDGARLIADRGKLLLESPLLSFSKVAVSVLDVSVPGKKGSAETKRVISSFKFSSASKPPVAVEPPDTLDKNEEFFRAVSLGLFDYMQKSRSKGYVVSLSGGVDSAALSVLCASSLILPVKEIGLDEVKKRLSYWKEIQEIRSIDELLKLAVICVYQATENSSDVTFNAARSVASGIGASFLKFDISKLVNDYIGLLSQNQAEVSKAGLPTTLSWLENDTPLQNIQARVRGPGVWLVANLKNALLLATSNRSEASVGYTTMDGDTCGGLSPIAGVDKAFLREWLKWMEIQGSRFWKRLPELKPVNEQEPTAELRPKGSGQTDEADLMPYTVLDRIERLAVKEKLTPKEILEATEKFFPQYNKDQLKNWVKRFHILWSQNQWKRERYAPSFHLDDQSVDPKTWCRFPILSGGYKAELGDLDK